MFPKQLKTTQNCSDNGVLGPLTGMIGSLQAMEVLKILMNKSEYEVYCNKLLMVDLMSGIFQSIKYTNKEECVVCGKSSFITLDNFVDLIIPESCSFPMDEKDVDICHISCKEYEHLVQSEHFHILLDVRNETQFQICSLPHSKSKYSFFQTKSKTN